MKTSLHILLALARGAAVLAVATSVGGCVAAKHYDEARSVAETEMAGHARTRARLASALARVDGLEKELRDREVALSEQQQKLDAGESLVATSKLETTVANTEKRAAGELVDQLRAELARTGDHLRVFSHDKRDLEKALLMAEERLRSVDAASKGLGEMVGAARDLAVGLGDLLGSGDASLAAEGGMLVLRIPSDRLFVDGESALAGDAAAVVATVARAAAQHPSYRVLVREPQRTTPTQPRTEAILQALRDRGVPNERLAFSAAPSPEQAPAPVADAAAPTDAPVEGRGDAPAAAAVPAPAPEPERYEIVLVP